MLYGKAGTEVRDILGRLVKAKDGVELVEGSVCRGHSWAQVAAVASNPWLATIVAPITPQVKTRYTLQRGIAVSQDRCQVRLGGRARKPLPPIHKLQG